jgi:formamidase
MAGPVSAEGAGTQLRFDAAVPLRDAPHTGHNRWHPAIPPLLEIEPGEVVTLDLRDGMDGQVHAGVDGRTLALDPGRGHPLTGPIAVAGAQPGDLLEVDVLALEPAGYGFTVVLPEYCLLAHRELDPLVVHWTIADGVARSPQLPGVAIRGRPFLGCLGVAPSPAQLAAFAAREAALEAELGAPLPGPMADGAVPPTPAIAAEALHTVPPRENGGNADVPHWGVGTRVLLPVEVPGALLSAGDPHFAQGDGEAGGTALETRATVTLRVGLRKAADLRWRPSAPAFERPGGLARTPERPVFATTGVSVDRGGRNRHLDVRVAAAAALDQLVDWLVATRGLTAEQALALASVAADLRIASLVNTPNAVVSAVLPLDVFSD